MVEMSQGRIFEFVREHKDRIIEKMKIEQAMAFQRGLTLGTEIDLEHMQVQARGIDYASEVVDRVLEKLEGGTE
jgi:hypothetical protein